MPVLVMAVSTGRLFQLTIVRGKNVGEKGRIRERVAASWTGRHLNVLFQVFHCTSDGKMSVENTVECWEGLHWAYIVPAVVAAAVVFVAFPLWLLWRIRHEAMASADQHHENFLKLKEVCVCWVVTGAL